MLTMGIKVSATAGMIAAFATATQASPAPNQNGLGAALTELVSPTPYARTLAFAAASDSPLAVRFSLFPPRLPPVPRLGGHRRL